LEKTRQSQLLAAKCQTTLHCNSLGNSGHPDFIEGAERSNLVDAMRRSPLSSDLRFSILHGMAAKRWSALVLALSGGSEKACRSGKAHSLGTGSPGHRLDRLQPASRS